MRLFVEFTHWGCFHVPTSEQNKVNPNPDPDTELLDPCLSRFYGVQDSFGNLFRIPSYLPCPVPLFATQVCWVLLWAWVLTPVWYGVMLYLKNRKLANILFEYFWICLNVCSSATWQCHCWGSGDMFFPALEIANPAFNFLKALWGMQSF